MPSRRSAYGNFQQDTATHAKAAGATQVSSMQSRSNLSSLQHALSWRGALRNASPASRPPMSPPPCSSVRRGTLLFAQKVFDVPIMGTFKLLHVMLWLTAVAFLSESGMCQQRWKLWTKPGRCSAGFSDGSCRGAANRAVGVEMCVWRGEGGGAAAAAQAGGRSRPASCVGAALARQDQFVADPSPSSALAPACCAGSARQVHLFHQQKEGVTFTTPNAEIRQGALQAALRGPHT